MADESFSVPAFRKIDGHDYMLQQGSPYTNHFFLNNAIDKLDQINKMRAAEGKSAIKYTTVETKFGPALYTDDHCEKCGKKLFGFI